MLAVLEVRLQLVEAQHGLAAEDGVVAGDLQLGQHVAHDAGHGPQVGQRDHGAVHRADLLLREPLRDAGVAEGMLTVRGLQGEGHAEHSLGARGAGAHHGRAMYHEQVAKRCGLYK